MDNDLLDLELKPDYEADHSRWKAKIKDYWYAVPVVIRVMKRQL